MKNLSRFDKALETLDRDKAVNAVEQRAKTRRDVQILLLAAVLRPDFEYHSNHCKLQLLQPLAIVFAKTGIQVLKEWR